VKGSRLQRRGILAAILIRNLEHSMRELVSGVLHFQRLAAKVPSDFPSSQHQTPGS
jgi:hypothetical protein